MALNSTVDYIFMVVTFLIVFPVIVRRFSTLIFHRTFHRNAVGKTPPTVPYWIPGIFHGVAILTQGPRGFFANTLKRYGSFAPFMVKAGPISFLIIRDADHITNIFQAAKQMTPRVSQLQYFDKVIGSPKEVLDLLKASGTGLKEDEGIDYAHQAIPRKYMSGESLLPMGETYTSTLRRNLADKMFQDRTWTEIEDMWTFFQTEITRATLETIFGSALLKSYPRIVRDFWEFEQNKEDLTRLLPRFMSKAYLARDRLHENLTKWLQSVHEGSEFAKLGHEDPNWDAAMGSKFFQATDSVFANISSLDYHARATEALAIMQQSISDTTPSTLWHMFEALRNPTLIKNLSTEIRPFCNPLTGKYDVAALTSVPIIQSIHAEVGRLRVATVAIRTNEADNFNLDKTWLIPKGTNVLIFSHDVGLNTELWARARPATVERPLKEFWPERFLIPEKNTKEKKDQIRTGRFSMEGVSHLHTTYGGGHHLCPGRYLAKAISVGTLAVILSEYEVQFSEPENAEQAIPHVLEAAYGTIKPSTQVRMRIRKRATPKQTKAS